MAPPKPKSNPSPFPSPFKFKQNFHFRTLVEFRMRIFQIQILSKPRWWEKVFDEDIVKKWKQEFVEQDPAMIAKYWTAKERNAPDPAVESPEEEEEGKAVASSGETKTEGVKDVGSELGEVAQGEVEDGNTEVALDGQGGGEGEEEEDDEDEEEQSADKKAWPRTKVTEAQLAYVFDELKWLAGQRDARLGIEMAGVPTVYCSHTLIPLELKEALIQGGALLENVPEDQKDWHPNTDNQVLDLVHPSLHCLRIGISLVKRADEDTVYAQTLDEYLAERSDLEYVPPTTWNKGSFSLSRQHQWLPTDFEVSENGDVTALSYINNLHPDTQKPLCKTITSILQLFVPLWERVLGDTIGPEPPLAIEVNTYQWYDHCEASEPNWDDFKDLEDDDEDDEEKGYEWAYEKWEEAKWPLIPDPKPFTPPPSEALPQPYNLKGKKLQVIIKMANIVLTPENPKYKGGSWHVEGMENERIVATGLYYYSTSNITESRLGFRQMMGDAENGIDIPYQQSDIKGFQVAFGIDGDRGHLNQVLGNVVVQEDECLAFPNIYQHRVTPFELDDATKPGHRKILCFFLVDPTIPVLSTSRVPPQQHAWYSNELPKAPILQSLPQELVDMVAEGLVDREQSGAIITMEQAKEERERLMKERANFVVQHNENLFEMEFNMCEH
ncbi:hypothetical protein JAAARDRAFT_155146 [Jaapia argillacea MUCL 33604]|uniref:Uncharacterized protein n=1 Tax=Jaapia argillacea MUCL 33604 TaxID=933084 RepID=A0A067Q538_9AGAM|nr:hypothetical protein JAAARDRAFT_155146 [Jaapia argillacea MUCL 33604]